MIALSIFGFFIFFYHCERLKNVDIGVADGIIALTGGGERIQRGLELLSQGMAKRLLITGVNPAIRRQDMMKNTPGFDQWFRCCVDLGYEALNTQGNAQEAQKWSQVHQMHSLIVVTSLYHLPRALTELKRLMPKVRFLPAPVPYVPPMSQVVGPQVLTIKFLVTEYIKFIIIKSRSFLETLFS